MNLFHFMYDEEYLLYDTAKRRKKELKFEHTSVAYAQNDSKWCYSSTAREPVAMVKFRSYCF